MLGLSEKVETFEKSRLSMALYPYLVFGPRVMVTPGFIATVSKLLGVKGRNLTL
jgi:hypothetical protein